MDDDDELFAEVERAAKGLAFTNPPQEHDEIREALDSLRQANETGVVTAPFLAFDDLSALLLLLLHEEEITDYSVILPWSPWRT